VTSLPGWAHVPMFIEVATPSTGDFDATGQLIADAVGACEWPSTAVVSRLLDPPDTAAAPFRQSADVVYLVIVRTKTPRKPVNKTAVTSMVLTQVSAAVHAVHGTAATCTVRVVSADVVERVRTHLDAKAWITAVG
jgi:hypothetical protein